MLRQQGLPPAPTFPPRLAIYEVPKDSTGSMQLADAEGTGAAAERFRTLPAHCLKVKNTFIDSCPQRTPSLERLLRRTGQVRSCPGSKLPSPRGKDTTAQEYEVVSSTASTVDTAEVCHMDEGSATWVGGSQMMPWSSAETMMMWMGECSNAAPTHHFCDFEAPALRNAVRPGLQDGQFSNDEAAFYYSSEHQDIPVPGPYISQGSYQAGYALHDSSRTQQHAQSIGSYQAGYALHDPSRTQQHAQSCMTMGSRDPRHPEMMAVPFGEDYDCVISDTQQYVAPATRVLHLDRVLDFNAKNEDLPPELGSEELPTLGSRGHHMRRCKPCAFVAKDGCANGKECIFCHLCEPGEKKRRRKEKRMIRGFTRRLAAGEEAFVPEVPV
jgi:hypothetical protein